MANPLDLALTLGLTQTQAAAQLAKDGYNELPSAKPRNLLAIGLSVVREPMFLLLVACGGIYLLLGDQREALTLLGFVFVIITITLVQEHKTERALDALRDLSSPRALVVRDGQQLRIAGRDVVRGDVLILAEGDRVPADGVLLSALNMTVDESLLTGESVPVHKMAQERPSLQLGKPGGDSQPHVFSGSLIVQGTGIAQVLATGGDTAIGRIGKSLAAVDQRSTRLQQETARVVKILAIACFTLAAILALWYGISRKDWLNGFLAGVTFAMALLPEELPVVLALFLGIGAWRLSRQQVLTRRIPAIEMLGAATVLCVDKTGTLTQNRMQLARLYANGRLADVRHDAPAEILPEDFHETLEFAMLASHRDPFDPMEKAIQEAGRSLLAGTEHLHDSWSLVDEYPLSRELMAMSRVWQSPSGDAYVIAAKGAPEAIADLCHLDDRALSALTAKVNELADQGLRVLGVARATFRRQALPEIQHDFDFRFLGLVALADPLRPTVAKALQEARAAGIRVIMITGDYPATARHIAQECGLDSPGGTLTGGELDAFDEERLRERIREVNIFCRVVPEQKLRLVKALQAGGEVVAMTGDGVNDAPALKAAHIGIAMGGRGTDVARESADLVLLNDEFSSIVNAVRLGRRVFDNFKKVSAFIIAVHIPIIGLSFVPVMMGWPLMLMPVHILFLQLIIDPTCSIVFEAEPEEAGIMRRPPRRREAVVFSRQVLAIGIGQGVLLLAALLAIYATALHRGLDPGEARAISFIATVTGSIGLIFLNRSWSRGFIASMRLRNAALWWVIAATAGFLALVSLVPSIRELLAFRKSSLQNIFTAETLVCAAILLLEAGKHVAMRGRAAGRYQ